MGELTVETPPAPYNAQPSLVTAEEIEAMDKTGTTGGAFRVTESGAASYTVPIYAVAGTAGVTPEMALSYNSQAGNGMAGLGWTVDGVSAIVRCRATRHQDGAARPIQWNDQDRFCLDGQRLVLASGTYGSPNSTYRTEIDSFARITALGGTAGHPDYFEVRRKDGSVSHYGNVPGGTYTDARQTNGAAQTLRWALKRFADSVGNPIWYVYANDADGHRLTEVRYATGSSRGDTDHRAKIEFVYEDRDDDVTGYVAGHAFSNRKRLDTVRVHNHDGTALEVLREYRLTYRDTAFALDKTSRLEAIEDCARVTGENPVFRCLKPTGFTWESATPGFNAMPSGEATLTPRDDRGVLTYQPADINGDGNLDLVWLEWDADGASDTDHHLRYALSDGTMLSTATFDSGVSSIELYEDVGGTQNVYMRTIDYNGDGRSDVILWRSDDPAWKVYLSAPQGTGDWKLSATPLPTPVVELTANFSDLNGDGLTDVVYSRGRTVYARYLEHNPAQGVSSSQYYEFGEEVSLYTRPQSGTATLPGQSITARASNFDFDGDGRADFVATLRNFVLGTPVLTTHQPMVIGSDGAWTSYGSFTTYAVHPVDINRDGLTDLFAEDRSAVDGNNQLTVQVAINTGSGFVSQALGVVLDGAEVRILEPFDYNGDGHPDFIWHDRAARSIKAYLWNPEANALDTGTARTVRTTDGDKKRAHLFFDMNGDGNTDYLYLTKLNTDGKLYTYLSNDNGKNRNGITQVANGLGAVTDIAYETLSNTEHYERLDLGGTTATTQFCFGFLGVSGCSPYTLTTVSAENIAKFYTELNSDWNLPSGAESLGKVGPVLEFTGPVPVVTRVASSAPRAGSAPGAVDTAATSAVEYYYAEAKVQAMGRGLLGFQQLKTRDLQTLVETTTSYRQDFPFTGLPVSTEVTEVRTSSKRLLSASETTWKLKGYQTTWGDTARTSGTAAVGAFQPYAAEMVEKTYDLVGGTDAMPDLVSTVTTQSAYDDRGNAISLTVTTAGGGRSFETETTNVYGPTEADRQLGRLTRTTVTKRRNEDADPAFEATSERVSAFNYYGQAGCPVTSTAHAGLLCQEIVEPDTAAFTVTTTHTYDTHGNRVKSKVAYFDDTPTPGGTAVTGADRIKTRCDAVTATYDTHGRFVESTADCLGRRTSEVTGRDAYGSPTDVKRYLDAAGSRHVSDRMRYTARGLEYFRASDNGAHALTTRAMGNPAGNPSDDVAQCPAGTAFHERVRTGGGGESVRCYDVLARETRTAVRGFDATWVHTDTEYDDIGRVVRASEPHYRTDTGCKAGTDSIAPQSKCHTQTGYDILGRVTRVALPDGSATTMAYDSLETTTTNALNQTAIETTNVLGETIETRDHDGGTVAFVYDAQGNLTSATRRKPATDATAAPASVITSMTYNAIGQKTGMTDPDRGSSTYTYNALGEMRCRQGAAGHFSVMTYDGLGRMTARQDYRRHASAGCTNLTMALAVSREANAAWTYDTAANGLGQLQSVSDDASGYRRMLDYDALGRASTASTVPGTGNTEHHEKTTYDQYGRTFQVFDASRTSADFTHSGVRHVYNARGYPETLQDAVGTEDAQGRFTPSKVYRTVTTMDARGNVVRERLGNGVARSHRFDGETGRVLAIRSGLLTATDRQALSYTWDALGNLKTRTRGTGAPVETFTYDGLNRLTSYALGAQPARAVTYDGYGNIRTKTGTGTYAYGSDAGAAPSGTAGPHAVASVSRPASGGGTTTVSYSYDANGNNVASTDGRTIAYTAFDKPTSIVKGSHTTAFAYAPDRARFKRTDTDAQGTTTTLYLGSVEKITRPGGLTQLKRHIGGVVIETTGPATGRCTAADATVTLYRLNDHLGSVDALLNEAGGEDQAMRFDPWGRRTDAATGSDLTDTAAMTFDHCATTRGFTNHEMLDEVGVIHMNGRIYDPTLARFLQADPFVQFPNNLQNHNRYSYVMNNPLAYTDPSGHFIFTLSAMIFAAQHGITMTTIAAIGAAGFADALVQGASFEQALQSGFLSGISAAAFSGIGNVLGTHFGGTFAAGLSPTGFGLKVALHGTVGGITSALGGGKFGHGFVSGAVPLVVAGPIGKLPFERQRILATALVGGTVSKVTGGKFASGAATAAFSRAMSEKQARWQRSQQAAFGGRVNIQTELAVPSLSADSSSASTSDAAGPTRDLSPPPIVDFQSFTGIASTGNFDASGTGGVHTPFDRERDFERYITGGFSAEALRRQHVIFAGSSLATVPAALIVPIAYGAAPIVTGMTSHAARLTTQLALKSRQAMIASTMALEVNAAAVSFSNQLLIQNAARQIPTMYVQYISRIPVARSLPAPLVLTK